MDWKTIFKQTGKGNWIKMVVPAVIALVLIKMFAPQSTQFAEKDTDPDTDKPFSIKTCLETIPEDVKGLKIVEGSRSRKSIIHEMVPFVCQAKAIFEKMQAEGVAIEPGSMIVKVVVEYNGEVISVKITESGITSRPFRNKVIGLIADSDFSTWQREDIDTVFLYPIHFGPKL